MPDLLHTMPAVVLLALLAAGCGDDPAPDRPGGGDDTPSADAAWRTSTDPADPTGLVWLADTTVHLADGSTVELAEPTETYVVAGDGVFSLVDPDEGSTVLFTAPGEESVDTGLDLVPESLQASPDGRYLAGVSRSVSDEDDRFGTPLATVVVLDLQTGAEVVSSTEGMGDTGSDDLADLYSESEIGGLAFVDGDTVVAETTDGERAYDLDSGETREPGTGEEIPVAPVIDSAEALTGPDGRWRIVKGPELADTVRGTDGGQVVVPRPDADRWVLDFWLDSTTVVGVVVDGPGGRTRVSPDDEQTMMTCTVPSGACEVYGESTGTDVTFPQDAGSAAAGLLLSGEPS